ncbi:MAG: hypothetical protein U0802_22925 [Candidatus Binatia bacterium]
MKARLYGSGLQRALRGYDALAQVRTRFAHARAWGRCRASSTSRPRPTCPAIC